MLSGNGGPQLPFGIQFLDAAGNPLTTNYTYSNFGTNPTTDPKIDLANFLATSFSHYEFKIVRVGEHLSITGFNAAPATGTGSTDRGIYHTVGTFYKNPSPVGNDVVGLRLISIGAAAINQTYQVERFMVKGHICRDPS